MSEEKVPKRTLQIPEEKLIALGIDVVYLKEHDPATMQALESGRKTKLLSLTADFGGQKINTAAKIHLWEDANGEVIPFIHTVRPTVNLKSLESKGQMFAPDEVTMLLDKTNGMLPYPLELNFSGKRVDCLIGVDFETREIVFKPVSNVFVPKAILGVDISQGQKEIVQNGGKILLTGLTPKEGDPYNAIVHYSFNKNNGDGGLAFKVPTPKLIQEVRLSEGKVGVVERSEISKNAEKSKDKKVSDSPAPNKEPKKAATQKVVRKK